MYLFVCLLFLQGQRKYGEDIKHWNRRERPHIHPHIYRQWTFKNIDILLRYFLSTLRFWVKLRRRYRVFLFCSNDPTVCCYANTTLFWLFQHYNLLKSGRVSAQFFFSSSELIEYFRSLYFHMNFRNNLSIFIKRTLGFLLWFHWIYRSNWGEQTS